MSEKGIKNERGYVSGTANQMVRTYLKRLEDVITTKDRTDKLNGEH